MGVRRWVTGILTPSDGWVAGSITVTPIGYMTAPGDPTTSRFSSAIAFDEAGTACDYSGAGNPRRERVDVIGVGGDHHRRFDRSAHRDNVRVSHRVAPFAGGVQHGADELGQLRIGGHHDDPLPAPISRDRHLGAMRASWPAANLGQRHSGAANVATALEDGPQEVAERSALGAIDHVERGRVEHCRNDHATPSSDGGRVISSIRASAAAASSGVARP